MTRLELYELIWKDPIVHVAKRFGISDVALRKTCIRHNVPTPPLGYWAKLAHGKKVIKPELPSLKQGEHKHVHLHYKIDKQLPEHVTADLASVKSQEAEFRLSIKVPKTKPAKLHHATTVLEGHLLSSKESNDGFLSWGYIYKPSLYLSKQSTQRAMIILDSLFKAIEAHGGTVRIEKDIDLTFDDEPFQLVLRESRGKRPYEPTAEDLKEQARYNQKSREMPSLYPPKEKVWRSWDHYPSGRLGIELTDPKQSSWTGENLVGRWYDRKAKSLEDYLQDTIPALAAAAVIAKHNRAEKVEKACVEAEREDLRRREKARRQRIQKRRDYLTQKAVAFASLEQMRKLRDALVPEVGGECDNRAKRIVQALEAFIEMDELQFQHSAISGEVDDLGLFSDED